MSGTTETGIPANTPTEGTPPPANDAGGTAPQTSEPTESEGEPEPASPHPPEPEWLKKRLARYTFGAREAERQRDEAARERDTERQTRIRYETELAVFRNGAQPGQQPPGAPPLDAETIRRQAVDEATTRIRAEVAQREAHGQFDRDTNAMVAAGKAAHPDFDNAVQGWRDAGLNIETSNHREIIGLINSLPDGAELFHRIGTNPDLAEHIANLSPVRAAYEIRGLSSSTTGAASATAQALAAQPPASPVVSMAPRPPQQPAAARGAPSSPRNIYDPKISVDDYIRARGYKK